MSFSSEHNVFLEYMADACSFLDTLVAVSSAQIDEVFMHAATWFVKVKSEWLCQPSRRALMNSHERDFQAVHYVLAATYYGRLTLLLQTRSSVRNSL